MQPKKVYWTSECKVGMSMKHVKSIFRKLAEEMPCDFVGVATCNSPDRQSKWTFVVGNRNDKYKRITVRYGRGIAGNVIKTGVPFVIQSLDQVDVTDFPIMLAEKLASCIAVPIFKNEKVWGVLLAGHRDMVRYEKSSIQTVKATAEQIQQLLTTMEFTPENEVI